MAKGDKVTRVYYMSRTDGVELYRFATPNIKNEETGEFWPPKFKIKQDQTGTLYDEAIDVENAPYTYTETDIPAESDIEPSPIDEDMRKKSEAFDYLTGRSNTNE